MTWIDCINKVETLFNQEYPLQPKRLEFLGYKAPNDEQLSNTIAKMMELALHARQNYGTQNATNHPKRAKRKKYS